MILICFLFVHELFKTSHNRIKKKVLFLVILGSMCLVMGFYKELHTFFGHTLEHVSRDGFLLGIT